MAVVPGATYIIYRMPDGSERAIIQGEAPPPGAVPTGETEVAQSGPVTQSGGDGLFNPLTNPAGAVLDDPIGFVRGISDQFVETSDPTQQREVLDRTRGITAGLEGKTKEPIQRDAPTVDVNQTVDTNAPQSNIRDVTGPKQGAFDNPVTVRDPVAERANAAGVGSAEQTQSRGGLVSALDMTRDAALGNVPSAADLQAQRASDRALREQRGLAASLQGRSVGGAIQAATSGAANQIAEIQAAGAERRAAEQAAARGQLLQGSAALSGQDIDVSKTAAALQTDVNKLNASLALQAAEARQRGDLVTADRISRENGIVADLEQRALIANQNGDIEQWKIATQQWIALNNLRLAAAQGNQEAIIRMRQLDDAANQGNLDAFLKSLAIEAGLAAGIDAANAGNTAAQNQAFAGLVSGIVGGVTGGAAAPPPAAPIGGGQTNYGDGVIEPDWI